jgi:hypothetical protein
MDSFAGFESFSKLDGRTLEKAVAADWRSSPMSATLPRSTTFILLLVTGCMAGCAAAGSTATPTKGAVMALTSILRPAPAVIPPNRPPTQVSPERISVAGGGCLGVPISPDGFGGCPFGPPFKPEPGRVWQLCDGFTPRRCVFIRQEIWPGFDGITGIVFHYRKADFRTGQRVAGDDGGGYWCEASALQSNADAELYFGLIHVPADPTNHVSAGWYARHQLIKCNGILGATRVGEGPGYLFIADFKGDTGNVAFTACFRPGVFIDDPTAWSVLCVPGGENGWETSMTTDALGRRVSFQSEGPKALPGGCKVMLDCRFFARETATYDCDPSIDAGCHADQSVDMVAIGVIDDGVNGDNTDPRLSMRLVAVYQFPQ